MTDNLDNRQVPPNSLCVHGLRVYGCSRHSFTSRATISMTKLKERQIKERLAQEMKALRQRKNGLIEAVHQDLETA